MRRVKLADVVGARVHLNPEATEYIDRVGEAKVVLIDGEAWVEIDGKEETDGEEEES